VIENLYECLDIFHKLGERKPIQSIDYEISLLNSSDFQYLESYISKLCNVELQKITRFNKQEIVMMNKQKCNRKQKHWSSVLALIGVIGGLALVSDDGLIPVANAQDDLVYVPLASPCRVVNTRNTTSTHLIAADPHDFFSYGSAFTIGDQGGSNAGCDHPRSAEGIQPAAMAANVTAVGKQATGNGNITAYPAGSGAPSASTVNYTQAANIANSTIIALRTSDGSFTLLSNGSDVPVVVDVVGYFYEDRTAALCELYQVLFEGGYIGALPVPEFCS